MGDEYFFSSSTTSRAPTARWGHAGDELVDGSGDKERSW
ncbi:hypothetical protein T261_7059 [Streptomyces lydicus]|nr:hypothetical protein T261_7059 [Streptomyces lydicus]